MKIGVSGATGFLGTTLVQELLARGHEVIGLTRAPPKTTNSKLRYLHYELGEILPESELEGLDAFVHCAYDPSHIGSPQYFETNVEGSIRLFHQLHHVGVERLLFVSSMSSFSGCRSIYGQSKLAVEQVVYRLGGFAVRPGTIYSDSSGGLLGNIERIVHKLPIIPAIGGRKLILYLVHVQTVCKFLISVCEHGWKTGSAPVCVAEPKPISLKQLIERIVRKNNLKRIIIPVPSSLALVGLRIIEKLGIRLGIGSDSLIGLMYANPHPELAATAWLEYREAQVL